MSSSATYAFFGHALIWIPVAIVVAVLMDVWSMFLHGKFWHGVLWFIHKSHHEPRRGAFEHNDALSLLHAPIAIALILYGCAAEPGWLREVAYGLGIGMTMFGLSYVIMHDGLVHGRLPVSWLLRFRYVRLVAKAHGVHHEGATGGVPYGFFLGPWELRRARRRR